MSATIHILATVRKPDLLPAALLVFKTLRTGFPSSPAIVWGNALDSDAARALQAAAEGVGARFINLPATSHDAWIESLVGKLNEPFWICDTDVVFVQRMAEPAAGTLFAGRYEPEFNEEFTETIHVARLHTAVMWIDPANLRCAIRTWQARIPEPWRSSAQFALVRQHFIPVLSETHGPLFYDTMAGLWQAGMGEAFTEEQNAAFEHLHCSTYVDEVIKGAPSLQDLQSVHKMIYANPQLARGLRLEQDLYYKSRAKLE